MDKREEFQKLYQNGCGVKNWDWNTERYFDSTSDCYKSEAALMSSLTEEAYGMYGFEVDYYIKKMDLERDVVMGEDVLGGFERRFRIKIYSESLPTLQKQYSLQGMIYTEIIECDCSIEGFREASKIDYISGEEVWDEYEPKIGDVMYMKWCDLYYEILNVKKYGEGTVFLGSGITWKMKLRVWRNSHEEIEEGMDDLESYVSLGEVFNMGMKEVKSSGDILSINEEVESEKESQVVYGRENKEEGPKKYNDDVFGGW